MSSVGRTNNDRRANAPAGTPPAAAPAQAAAAQPAAAAPGGAAPTAQQTSFTTARQPAATPQQDAASAAVNAREARRGAKYAEYDRLLADGKLDVAIGVGYDETGADQYAWSDL